MVFKYKYKPAGKFKYLEDIKKILKIVLPAVIIVTILLALPIKKEKSGLAIIEKNETEICYKKFFIYCYSWSILNFDPNLKPEGGWKIYSRNNNCKDFEDSKEACLNILSSVKIK